MTTDELMQEIKDDLYQMSGGTIPKELMDRMPLSMKLFKTWVHAVAMEAAGEVIKGIVDAQNKQTEETDAGQTNDAGVGAADEG